MKAKNFLVLIVATGAAAFGAYWLAMKPATPAGNTPPGQSADPQSTEKTRDAAAPFAPGDRILPALSHQADEIHEIQITRDGETVHLIRDDNEWRLASKANFPAEADRVRALMTALSELRILEPKTARPEFFDRLAVQWPDETADETGDNADAFGPRPTLVTIAGTDASAPPIAQIVLGDTSYTGGEPRQYARILGDDQSWLVNTTITIPRGPLGFVNTRFVELPRDSVQSVTITHPTGEILELTRDDPAGDFVVADLPEGSVMTNQALANNTGNALAFVNFTDIEELTDENDRIRIPLNATPGAFLVENQVSASFLTFDDQYYYLVIDEIRENSNIIAGWVRTHAQGEGTDDVFEKFGDRRVKLPAGTIEALTRKPSELIMTQATDEVGPSPAPNEPQP